MDVPARQTTSHRFLDLIHHNTGTGCWSVRLSENEVWLSDACFDLLHIRDKKVPAFDYFLDVMVHPNDRHIITKAIKQLLHHRNVNTCKIELRIKDSDGTYHWFELVADAALDDVTGSVDIAGIIASIDERKILEAESDKLKLMTDVVDEIMGVGIMEYDFVTHSRFLSKGVYDILELAYDTPASVIVYENFCNPKDLKRYQQAIFELKSAKKPFDLDIRLFTAKSNTCWIRTKGKPVLDEKGNVTGFRSIVQKIEKEKLKENFLIEIRDKITEQKFFLDETSAMSNVGGWEYDLENQTLFWSEQTKIMHGVDASYTPTLDNAFRFYTNDSFDLLSTHYKELIENGRAYDLELELITAKSELIWIRAIGKPVYRLGQIVKVRGVAQNITKLKLREIELNESLQIIHEQNDKLKDFTHIVSHNLRSHAGNLKMITEMIEMETDVDLRQEWMGLVKQVSSSLSETVNNLNGLVNLSRENKKRLSFTETFNTVEKGINYKIISNDVELKTDFSACDSVDYVPAYLESIMLNLITNAIKYRHPARKPVVSLQTEFKNSKPMLKVTDNGLGIDLALYGSRLFKMNQTFHQNSDARGIGLYITKNQIENMGGSIDVESKVDEGTTFTVHF